MPDQRSVLAMRTALLDRRDASSQEAFAYLTQERGLDKEVLQKYNVGVSMEWFRMPGEKKKGGEGVGGGEGDEEEWRQMPCIAFPWMRKHKQSGKWLTVRVKVRGLWRKHLQRLKPAGGHWGLFGLSCLPACLAFLALPASLPVCLPDRLPMPTCLPACPPARLPHGQRMTDKIVTPLSSSSRLAHCARDGQVGRHHGGGVRRDGGAPGLE